MLAGRKPKLVRIASVALTFIVWEWYGRGVDPIFFSYPTAILEAVPAMVRSGELQSNLFASVQAARRSYRGRLPITPAGTATF